MSVSTAGSVKPAPTTALIEGNPQTSALNWKAFMTPLILLGFAYGLLALTLTEHISHHEIMQRCVLVDPKLSRIWSVGNIEIGMAYFGVFGGMVWYFLGVYRKSAVHLTDLGYAFAYLVASFTLDAICVRAFTPFVAMLIGDAVVMTFTLVVSRQLWFQRLLGVFIPLIFLTCGLGHFLEGISYWFLTYPVNVPWTMVTADIGFAVLVNSSRFPAFIRGEDVLAELSVEKQRGDVLRREIADREVVEKANQKLLSELAAVAERQHNFLRDVLASVTEGRLRLCRTAEDLPRTLNEHPVAQQYLVTETLAALRAVVRSAASAAQIPPIRLSELVSASGEASMNAVVHAGHGDAKVYLDSNRGVVQIWITDKGRGIDLDCLPRATLERGYTTSNTLGHGFRMMLQCADQIHLLTGSSGTTVVIEQYRESPAELNWIVRT